MKRLLGINHSHLHIKFLHYEYMHLREQENPFPENPVLQVQLKLPLMFLHSAFGEQTAFWHSSMSII